MAGVEIKRKVLRPFVPALDPKRFTFLSGGRASGKSHFLAEQSVLGYIDNPNQRTLCIREVQRSIRHSAKHLIESKIEQFGLGHYFDIYRDEIRSRFGDGLIVFAGMQDHTADSIKSFEDFDIAWFEEAHRMSERSRKILIPTIRKPGSRLWFSWNPENEDDAIESLANSRRGHADAVHVHVDYRQNPLCSTEVVEEAETCRDRDADEYDHVWLGNYVQHSEARVLADKARLKKVIPQPDWDGPYQGVDFGFSQDPAAAVRVWLHDDELYVEKESGGVGIELDDLPGTLKNEIPGFEDHDAFCDNSEPSTISYIKRHGLPRAKAVDKKGMDHGKGSIRAGIRFLRSLKWINVDPSCVETWAECRLYSYKVDKLSGRITDDIIDRHNHWIDAIRYALSRVIRSKQLVYRKVRTV